MSSLFRALISVGIATLAVWGGYLLHTPAPASMAPTLGASSFTPVGGTTYTLSGAGVNSSATTVNLNSFKTPDGRALTMSMFGTIGYAVIDPNSPTKIEDITFTGITQNPNGTAILTGVSRGMDFVSPYLSSTTLAQSHSGGSYLILSNTAGFYGQQFLFANNVATSTATLVFSSTTPPRYDGTTDFSSNPLFLIDRAYADALSIQGSPTSTFNGMGQVRLATDKEVASSTASSTLPIGQPLVIPAKFSTTTPGILCTTGIWNCVPVAQVSGKISQNWLDLTISWAFSLLTAVNATTTGNQYFTNAALTSTLLKTDSTGKLSAAVRASDYAPEKYTYATTTDIVAASGTYATSTVFTFPAGTLTASSSIQITGGMVCSQAGSCSIYLRSTAGTTFGSCVVSPGTNVQYSGYFQFTTVTNNSTVSQTTTCNLIQSNNISPSLVVVDAEDSTSALNFSTLTSLVLVIQGASGTGVTLQNAVVIVNP